MIITVEQYMHLQLKLQIPISQAIMLRSLMEME